MKDFKKEIANNEAAAAPASQTTTQSILNPDSSCANKFTQMVQPVRFGPNGKKNATIQNAERIYDEDYLNVIISPTFRRLQDKAQVFPLEISDFVRTRLTHSIEVSHFAYALGRQVEEVLFNRGYIDKDVYNSHSISLILRVAGLIHDIGNPPFGHFGEDSIQIFYKNIDSRSDNDNIKIAFQTLNKLEKADLLNFDGNVQGLRVVTKLALADNTLSLNLSMPIIATMIKYPFNSIEGNKKHSKDGEKYSHCQDKFGYFKAEKNSYNKLCTNLGLQNGQRHPLAYLLEAADDIAYSVSDIEDGHKLGIISVDCIKQLFTNARLGKLLPKGKYDGRDDEYVRKLRTSIQEKMLNDCAIYFCDHFSDMVENTYAGDPVLESSNSLKLREVCKQIADLNFKDNRVLKHELLGGEVISALLERFVSATLTLHKHPELHGKEKRLYTLIARSFRRVMSPGDANKTPQKTYGCFMLVNDFISGMTDTYALNMYKDLITGDNI